MSNLDNLYNHSVDIRNIDEKKESFVYLYGEYLPKPNGGSYFSCGNQKEKN